MPETIVRAQDAGPGMTDQQRQWVEDWQVHIRIVEKLFGEGRPVEIVRRSSYDLLLEQFL